MSTTENLLTDFQDEAATELKVCERTDCLAWGCRRRCEGAVYE